MGSQQAPTRKKTSRERAAALRRAQQRRERRRTALMVGGAVLVAFALVAGAVWGVANGRSKAKSELAGVKVYDNLKANHVTSPVDYPQNPPPGGPHLATPQTCGVYTSPVTAGNALHSLEHGAVWVTYRPTLPKAQVTALQDLVRGNVSVLLSPDSGQPAPVVATAWGRQLRLQSADAGKLKSFVSRYRNGSNAPEPGAACTGVGSPQK